MRPERLKKISDYVYAAEGFQGQLEKIRLGNIDDVFKFNQGVDLKKANIAKHRSRVRIELDDGKSAIFLKRYNGPGKLTQINNWISCRKRISCSYLDFEPAEKLSMLGINTPETVFLCEQWGMIFEKRSAIATQKIKNAESLEKKLPDCFYLDKNNKAEKNKFINDLAKFIKKFHQTGYRHRDLYFAHIFYNEKKNRFYLIDLARCFRPVIFKKRFTIKDIAQLYYSAPGRYLSKTDRLRFYKIYAGIDKLRKVDKKFIVNIRRKLIRMSRHDRKHNRPAPYEK